MTFLTIPAIAGSGAGKQLVICDLSIALVSPATVALLLRSMRMVVLRLACWTAEQWPVALVFAQHLQHRGFKAGDQRAAVGWQVGNGAAAFTWLVHFLYFTPGLGRLPIRTEAGQEPLSVNVVAELHNDSGAKRRSTCRGRGLILRENVAHDHYAVDDRALRELDQLIRVEARRRVINLL